MSEDDEMHVRVALDATDEIIEIFKQYPELLEEE